MIGRLLDKYEILEEVGHGGMAVVYKGRDTALQREVAIKILHPHLASHDEARARFEREAQAVAKLRHENILEIFDYSGKGSADSYIVTEFIRGATLKELVAARAIAYPEIAAMLVAEACRALEHAHSLGVLHRDVKPENIMIRDDGVLKLTDFGIAQIVDAQRMTVTGQLLGSPAYMSPEHVEGRPLDFRTDVFSVGILLYQLATGELPFKGRNPHEILKRIAECRFLDPRVVNPLVGERLGRVIGRALAREPDGRYPDVASLLADLRAYLGEAGLTDVRAELGRYFAGRAEYEEALRPRLVGALTERGLAELGARRFPAALELFNRVLTLDPSNERVLAEIDRLSRRRRLGRSAIVVGAAVLLAGGGVGVLRLAAAVGGGPAGAGADLARAAGPDGAPAVATPPLDAAPDAALRSPLADAAPAALPPPDAALRSPLADAAPAALPPPDARPAVVHLRPGSDAGPGAVLVRSDAAPAVVGPAVRHFRIVPAPNTASYSVDGGPFVQTSAGRIDLDLGPGAHEVRFQHPYCEDWALRIGASFPPNDRLVAPCRYKSASLVPVCEGADIQVNGKLVHSGTELPILADDFDREGRYAANVQFRIEGRDLPAVRASVRPGETKEVRCARP